MQQPKLLSKVWAALGLKNDIPDSRKTGIPNESATYEDGFPQITMTPIALGGKAPSGKDMNGILNELSAHTVYQNQGGIYKFDSAFAEKIGGYSKGSLLINNKLDKLFISLVDKNKTDFNSQDFSGKWEVVSGVNFFVPKTQKATLQETGIVKLYSGYDSDSEEMAATPKVIKILKSWIDAITRNLSNYIPNSKKSSSVDSNSADDVATSAAVKTAYDKAVAAKNVADNAVAIENDATYQNSRIRIGWLRTSPYGAYLLVDSTNQGKIITDNYLSPLVNSNNNQLPASVAGVKIAYDKGVEAKTAADNAQRTANDGVSKANAAQQTANDANNNANTRQLKSELVGEVAFFARSTTPSGWLKANGAAVSRTTYAALFAAIGTTFGAGDGRTTFNLPDMRGEFVRGVDDGRNVDDGRRLGTFQADGIKTHTINVPDSNSLGGNMGVWYYGERGGASNSGHNTITYNGEKETRPRNIALLACIKY